MTARNILLALALPILTATTVLAVPGTALAGELKGVVELFTSQGCSSCPPADEELARLAEQDDVLALSYHVDYWNYLGWADTLSSKANTARQYGYAKTFRRGNVYTPQAVINGQDHVNGADGSAVDEMLGKLSTNGSGLTVEVTATMNAEELRISIGPGQGKADIVAVYFDDNSTVKIERGENSGRTITYRHSVRDMETVGMWNGNEVNLKLPVSVISAYPGRRCAILLQEVGKDGTPGRILGAARI
ncbi:MAG: DUF1223 domain-containing protein [Hoeflea sp.]|uniref:DUF1223 domain-containing protein n=1 Tax=Hoeflea sp. TaxID=1940281 RepID=UPI003EF7FF43